MNHPEVNPALISRRLREAARRKRLDQYKIAERTGIDRSRISRFLSGDFSRMTPVLNDLCRHLEVRVPEKSAIPSKVPGDLVEELGKIVRNDPQRLKALRRIVLSLSKLGGNK